MKIAIYIVCAVYFFLFLLLLIISRKPFKYLFLNAVAGWWCFVTVNLFGFFTGIHVAVNWNNLVVNGVLGVPGTVLLILLKYCVFI